MSERDDFVTFDVDLTEYRNVKRQVGKIYTKPSDELVMLVVNFWYKKKMVVRRTKGYYSHKPTSHAKVIKALNDLQEQGYIKVHTTRWIDLDSSRATTYLVTDKFENKFKFRGIPERIWVTKAALTKDHYSDEKDRSKKRVDIALIPELKTYSSLVSTVKLSLSNGKQVFEDVDLGRKRGARIYQQRIHNYQNNIPKEERPFLLLDGKPTVELDYVSLHPCMLLNMEQRECSKTDIYSKLLKELRIHKTKKRRDAIKKALLIATNIDSVRGFYSCFGREETYKQYLKQFVKPSDIYDAIVKLYPELKRYLGTGKRAFELQVKDSEIMMDILETLAKKGIVSLPVHDSVICPEEHKTVVEKVMKDCYRQHMGFDIQVKAK